MATDDAPTGFSLKRWSRRKLEAVRKVPAPPVAPAAAESGAPVPAPGVGPVPAGAASQVPPVVEPAPLPPIDSLVFDSDFTPFMQPKVDEALKREALKKLFRDPRFNVMDRLDTYIDDYSLPDPIPPEMFKQLLHARSIFFPTKTRINAEGFVEDVPADEPDAPADAAALAPTPALPEADTAASLPAPPSPGAAAESAPPPEPGATTPRRDEPPPR